jgi:hypothetical protein
VATCRQHWSLNSLVWFLLKLSSFTSGRNSTSDLLEKLTYGTVRWNGCTLVNHHLY